MKVGIALGSNLGDRLGNLQNARDQISRLHGSGSPLSQSAVYETSPVGCEPGAQDFYNAVLEIDFSDSAQVLLGELRQIEQALGRAPTQTRNVSRTIDLDLLYFGNEELRTPELQLPHPRLKEREFVLRPLAEIAPDLRLRGETASVEQLLEQLNSNEQVQRVIEQW